MCKCCMSKWHAICNVMSNALSYDTMDNVEKSLKNHILANVGGSVGDLTL